MFIYKNATEEVEITNAPTRDLSPFSKSMTTYQLLD